ncbi:hypothetical protein [Desulfonatronum thioautotrophicum]|uniref:hypothetical protein n=1 Tax=Desulfonatronum thioautotrophicum TaxID=617001 RepID=UPI0005EAFBFC|nr:hypothetical protein [Desulfonatronum thioautotrophicum]
MVKMCQMFEILNGQRFTGGEFATPERRELRSHAGAWGRSNCYVIFRELPDWVVANEAGRRAFWSTGVVVERGLVGRVVTVRN